MPAKQIRKKRPRYLYLLLILLLVVIALLGLVNRTAVGCVLKGNKWLDLGPGPKGCFKEYGDAGKICRFGNECQSGSCLFISNKAFAWDDKLPTENLTGECSRYGSTNSQSTILFCGSARIENGKVVEDMRKCIY